MSRHALSPLAAKHHQRGVNLIEIMVSMVIGLFLVLGATTLYVKSKKTSDVDDSIARVQETARYAMSVLETDIRMANYWGFVKGGNNVSNKLSNPTNASGLLSGAAATSTYACSNNSSTNSPIDVENPVTATDNGYPFTCGASPSAAAPSSDTLTIRRAGTTIAALDTNAIQICADLSNSTIMYGGSLACNGANQQVRSLVTNIYYVDQGSDQSSTLPSLRRKILSTGPTFTDQEVIPGVEDMQIQLGWASSTASADAVEFRQPDTDLTTLNRLANGQVVAVRVWLLVRAEKPDYTYTNTTTYSYGDRTVGTATATLTANRPYAPNDNYQRLLLSRTFFIRNVVGNNSIN